MKCANIISVHVTTRVCFEECQDCKSTHHYDSCLYTATIHSVWIFLLSCRQEKQLTRRHCAVEHCESSLWEHNQLPNLASGNKRAFPGTGREAYVEINNSCAMVRCSLMDILHRMTCAISPSASCFTLFCNASYSFVCNNGFRASWG